MSTDADADAEDPEKPAASRAHHPAPPLYIQYAPTVPRTPALALTLLLTHTHTLTLAYIHTHTTEVAGADADVFYSDYKAESSLRICAMYRKNPIKFPIYNVIT